MGEDNRSDRTTGIGTALVTGAAKRIGAAVARDLAAHGFAVAVHYHASSEAAETLVDDITRDDGTAQAFAADLTDPVQTGGLIDAVREKMGPVSLLVNNASIFLKDSALKHEQNKWALHFAVHARAPAQLAAAFAAQPDIDDGLIVNMIDQRVWRLNPNYFSYTLSKSALWAATQTLAQALAPKIRVNAIGPGPVLKSRRQDEEHFNAQVEALPLKHGPSTDEIGATIRYLFDTPSVTGQMIALDGGQHLAWETPDITGIPE